MNWRDRAKRVLGHSLAAFGEAVTHTPLSGSPIPRKGIYNDTFSGIDENGFDVVSQEPNLGIILAHWNPLPRQGDGITLRGGVTYRVDRVEVDGEGGATAFLTKNISQVATPNRSSGFSAVSHILSHSLAKFGEAVIHVPDGTEDPIERRGIFNDIYKPAQTGAGFDVVTQEPNLGVKLSDWTPAPAQNDLISLRGGVTYRVERVEVDGEGGATLFLTKNITQIASPDKRSGFAAVENILHHAMQTFATPIGFFPIGGFERAQFGIFNDRYEGIDADTGAIVVSQQPNVGIRLSDWPLSPVDGDVMMIYGDRYTVRHMEVDGEGGATVILDKVNEISGNVSQEFEPDEFDGGFA